MRSISILVILVITLGMTIGLVADDTATVPDAKVLLQEAQKLFKARNYVEALVVVEKGIKYYPSDVQWKAGKYFILKNLQRFDDALKAAFVLDKARGSKTPQDALEIAQTYLIMKKNADSLTWLGKAVDRGFSDYNTLERVPMFKPLHAEKGWKTLIERIKTEKLGYGKPPKAFNLKDLKGKPLSLDKYKGKVVLIDFWATWCGPCVREVPALKKFYAEYKDKGFDIIGISLDKDQGKLTSFIEREKLAWPISYSGKGWMDGTAQLYGVKSIPSYWVIDKKGVLREFTQSGEVVKETVRKLLAE